MRFGGRMTSLVVGVSVVAAFGGCVSLDSHRRVKAQNRNLALEKEQLDQELFDQRSMGQVLRNRAESLERELAGKDELVANLRSENQLLEDMRKVMQDELERMAGKASLSPIHITGPKLPEPLDNALSQFADEHPTAVVYDPMRGTVKWKSDLLFALGSDVVKQTSMEALGGFSEIIKSPAAADFEVIVVGHTDNRPIARPATKQKHPTNWHLSAHRAIAVSSILRKNGYQPGRIGVMGYGEHRPVADNANEAGASQNRRVEVYLVPTGSIVPAMSDAGWQVDGTGLAFAALSR
jgi:chemotaxis protein MotB